MAQKLILKSERQIQAAILSKLLVKLGLTDANPGSVMDIITQAVAQQDFAQYYQIAQVSRLVDLNELTGTDLENKAFEYGLFKIKASKTIDSVVIQRPVGFVKVSTTFYAGSSAPISGQSTIDVNDASNVLIGSSGTLILGRGTNNLEEVSYTSAPVDNTNYWTFTLTTPLVNDHSISETVILKQGVDEVILAGTVITVPASGVSNAINFNTNVDTTLLSGEAEVTGVEVTAAVAGTSGNIPIGAIIGVNAFVNPPFPGARAQNLNKFTNGRDLETDDQLRDRIKNFIPSNSKGIKQAIKNAIVGLVDPETAKRVVSANVVLPLKTAEAVKVYIDDGTGFEPSFTEVGYESILDNSTGGEQRLNTTHFPVTKAQAVSVNQQPYNFSTAPLSLQYQVGNVSETINFQLSDFIAPSVATAGEVVEVINLRSTLLEARTTNGGSGIMVSAKSDTNENFQITGGTSNGVLGLPTDQKFTINLYKDDLLLSKDGLTALLDSQNQAPYDLLAIGSFPHTLTLVVDGKTANPQTATIQASDVAVQTAVTAVEIASVLNRDLSGIQASTINSNTKVRIQSLTPSSSSSKLHVTGGSANNPTNGLNFSTVQVSGINSDYTFNRELGIIELSSALEANSSITINSLFTRGFLRATNSELYFPSSGQTLVISVDGGATQTITFDSSFLSGQTAASTASFINLQLKGAQAYVRDVGGINYLEISTNGYSTNSSIRISSASTSNGSFGFTTNLTVSSSTPSKAYRVSSNSGPFDLSQNDSLVIVVDSDIVNNTFSILLNSNGVVSTQTSTTQFNAVDLNQVFSSNGQLDGYYVACLSGSNTDSTGVVDSVSNVNPNVWRYTYSTLPTLFSQFGIGDLVSFEGLNHLGNNGNFVINLIGMNWVDVFNPQGLATSGEVGTSVLAERRQISAYASSTGHVQVSSSFTNPPAVGNQLIVIPSTVDNLVGFISNLKLSSFSLVGTVEGVNNNTQLQISSKANGSDGQIQITGGNANRSLDFNTLEYFGIQGYDYSTGLVKLVSKTLYGDDSNLDAFPGVGAGGVTFRVLAPTINQLTISLKLTLANGVTISALQNEVKSAVAQYVNTLGVGDDVILEQIRAAVIAIPGITDVVVLSPTANVAIADNQRADVSDPNISIG